MTMASDQMRMTNLQLPFLLSTVTRRKQSASQTNEYYMLCLLPPQKKNKKHQISSSHCDLKVMAVLK